MKIRITLPTIAFCLALLALAAQSFAAERVAVYRLKILEGDKLTYDTTLEAPVGQTTWFKNQKSTPYIRSKGFQDTTKSAKGWVFWPFCSKTNLVKGESVTFSNILSGLEVSIKPEQQQRLGRLPADLSISLTRVDWQKLNGGATFGAIEQPVVSTKSFGQSVLLGPGESTTSVGAWERVEEGKMVEEGAGVGWELTLKTVYFKP